jgi:hypothetical protein
MIDVSDNGYVPNMLHKVIKPPRKIEPRNMERNRRTSSGLGNALS